jgi:hypothetical protein
MTITDNNTFDAFARERGWVYDNGGRYRDEEWHWYAGPVAGIVLLRQPPDQIAVVRFEGLKSTELWSGRVSTTEEFDEMINRVNVIG